MKKSKPSEVPAPVQLTPAINDPLNALKLLYSAARQVTASADVHEKILQSAQLLESVLKKETKNAKGAKPPGN